jgi:CheY-like chemotaxis protein
MTGHSAATRVLIVDDDPILGELLQALLTVEGYEVTQALSGESALDTIRAAAAKPQIVLCDIQMPGLHGSALAAALATARDAGELPANTVCLAMSGSSPRAADAQAFDGFLRKPFSMEDFAAAVTRSREGAARPAQYEEAEEQPAELPPLNLTVAGQLRAKIGADSTQQLYQMTLDDVRSRLKRMAEAAEAGDAETVRREAHTIKGSCGMVGALELQALATATEGGSRFDTSALAKFDSACKRLERMLNEKP